MKPSPLQLKWVTYPSASFESDDAFDGEPSEPIAATVEASVEYDLDGAHVAYVTIANDPEKKSPYKFSIFAMAQFSFDLERARENYKPKHVGVLPPIIAVNVCRILYAGARDLLATFTARAPYQSAILDSILLEPTDVKIKSDASPAEIIRQLFGATEEELSVLSASVGAKKKQKQAAADKPQAGR
ncbi:MULTISPECIES: hypothetical protein [unclassified Pseudoxanthomonas]|uniref:hypothetical protein n=1 Tax=unclassified Pseudoxanthomonas TaxID=2645906 RepID=UPI00161DACA2|nr:MULTISPECIES: hypothetical protein [unclassified Pseudoxanthomonas]MBB3274284.1 hypothetical protein [Pseudoxanthomonas sp. OG2]MBV7474792.1 hypothetical protein [Pseudoxanthomonas sp. PXM05]